MLESCIIMKVQSCLLSGKLIEMDRLLIIFKCWFFYNQLSQIELQWHDWLVHTTLDKKIKAPSGGGLGRGDWVSYILLIFNSSCKIYWFSYLISSVTRFKYGTNALSCKYSVSWKFLIGPQGLRVNPDQEHFVVPRAKCAILTVLSYSLSGKAIPL